MERHLYEHLNLTGHSAVLNDVYVTVTDKIDHKDPSKQNDY